MADRIGIDFSANFPSPQAVRQAGAEAVICYLSERRPSAPWMLAKPLTADRAAAYRAAGVEVVGSYQFGKEGDPTPSDWRLGYEGGKRHGQIALANHWKANGTPWRPCYAPVDANPTDQEIDDLVIPFLKGWAEVWGREWTGVYCNVPTWERIKKSGLALRWFWQHDWDGNRTDHSHHPDATMHQVRIDKDTIDGVGVDWNVLLRDDYGQWSKSVNPNPIETFPIANLVRSSGVGYDAGHQRRVRIYLHSSEGKDWQSTARGTMQYQASSQSGSYHYLIDDTEIIQTVSLDDSAWAVLSDNPFSVNVCLVLSSGASGYGVTAREDQPKSRAQWLEHTKMLKMLRFLLVHIRDELRSRGEPVIELVRVDTKGVGQNRSGVSSHNNYTYGSVALKGFKDGTHWDIPDTFPYDSVLDGTVAPVDPNAFPLPTGYYYGPLEGPEQSISGRAGEPQAWIDGLKRWQGLVGIPQTGVWDAATERVARQLQAEKQWPNSRGYVYRGEWDAVVRENWRPSAPPAARYGMPLPAGTYRVGSPYGEREGGFHRGQDFEAADGTPILAAADGVVELAGPAQGFGQWIVVKLDDGWRNVYGHMWSATTHVKAGDRVKVGQQIAKVGNNGTDTTGPHLHFEVLRPSGDIDAAERVEPMAWLAAGGATPDTNTPTPDPGDDDVAARKLADLTGDNTSRFGMRATDLGAMVQAPNGDIVAVFGDTFRDKVGGQDWRSPVSLIGHRNAQGVVEWDRAGGPDPKYARQLWDYRHDNSKAPGTISTVIPSDLLRVGDRLYLQVMVNRGFGNVVWTELWTSADNGQSWQHMGEKGKADGGMHGGYWQCISWDYNPDDGWVYAVGTGFQRDKGLVLKRVRPEDIGDVMKWWNWGWDGKKWGWGTPNPSVITPPGEKWGEITLRRLPGGWVLGGFLSSSYACAYRVVDSPLANMYTTPLTKLVTGTAWPLEDHSKGRVAQLYGGYVLPGSELDTEGGVQIAVSQWNTASGWPYRVMQFAGTLKSVVPKTDPQLPDGTKLAAALDQASTELMAYGNALPAGHVLRGGVAATLDSITNLEEKIR